VLVRAVDEILGTHNIVVDDHEPLAVFSAPADPPPAPPAASDGDTSQS
jgi:hypothetical protein